ncbi:hypothetical protein [Bacillus altitudinis]|uniref:hypothetical protein n=1 Tax=Bacillus altitudinis TaxID=293387 RepID=UPI0009EF964F|nr:hypothetical protein B2I20_17145 [Bacillus stratosphericus]
MIETSKTNALSTIEKQTSEYLKIKKDQEEARKIAKEQEALANRYECGFGDAFAIWGERVSWEDGDEG